MKQENWENETRYIQLSSWQLYQHNSIHFSPFKAPVALKENPKCDFPAALKSFEMQLNVFFLKNFILKADLNVNYLLLRKKAV